MLISTGLASVQEIGFNIIAAIAILGAGWMWGKWRGSLAWHRKQFKDRVLLSLNSITKQGDKTVLVLRTLFERDLHEVFQNTNMEKIVQKAIDEVRENDPILRLPKEDAWYVLNTVLNRISEQYAVGILRKDMGLAVGTKWYTFCLTFEKEGGLRIQKLRIMLLEKEQFLNFPESGEVVVESEKHKGRVGTLRLLRQEYQKNPHLFMNIELCV